MKKTSQRSLLFRQNVGRTEEWAHFLDGYRQTLIEFDMKKFGDDWHTAEKGAGYSLASMSGMSPRISRQK